MLLLRNSSKEKWQELQNYKVAILQLLTNKVTDLGKDPWMKPFS